MTDRDAQDPADLDPQEPDDQGAEDPTAEDTQEDSTDQDAEGPTDEEVEHVSRRVAASISSRLGISDQEQVVLLGDWQNQAEPHTRRRDLSESRVVGSSLLGFLLMVAFYLGVVDKLLVGTYLGAAFAERGVIPYITTFLCTTGGCLLLFGFLRIRREERTFRSIIEALHQRGYLDREAALESMEDVRAARRTHGGHIVSNRLLRALHTLTDGLRRRTDMRELGEIDQEILQAAHLPTRFIIWLIPVLGFTGTVLGISAAISGFSTIIEGAQDFAVAKSHLGEVALNLGVAFETTLLALIKTAILMYAFSALQKRERAFLIQVDEFFADDLNRRMVLPSPPDTRSEMAILTDAVEELAGRISTWDPRFAETLDSFFARLLVLSQDLDQGLSAHAERFGQRCDAQLEGFGERCDALGELAREALDRGGAAAERAASGAERLAESVERVGELQEGLNQNLRALTALEDFNRCLDALRVSADKLPDAVRDLQRPRRITFVEAVDAEGGSGNGEG